MASYCVLVTVLVIQQFVLPLLLVYHVIRFLYLKIKRTIWTIHMLYHKRVTQDWWSAYIARRSLRKIDFIKTYPRINYELDLPSNLIDIMRRTESMGYIDPRILLTTVTNVLVDNEIYLRTAHYSHDGFLHNYTVDISCCIVCSVHLPRIACFLGNYYYCLECIRTEVLSRFCSERIFMLRATGLIPDDVVYFVIQRMVLLSFDHRQISMAHTQCTCQCDLYDCQSEYEKSRELNLKVELGQTFYLQ